MPLPFGDWVEYFTYGNQIYGAPLNQTLVGNKQRVTPNFLGLSQTAYKQNGIVFALIMTRTMLFSEARFQYRRRENGRPGDLFDGPGLEPLVHPWNGATTATCSRSQSATCRSPATISSLAVPAAFAGSGLTG